MLADSKSHGTLLLLIDALRALVLCVEHGRPLKAPNVSDEQMKCAGAAAKEYLTADAAFARRATANGVMSVVPVANQIRTYWWCRPPRRDNGSVEYRSTTRSTATVVMAAMASAPSRKGRPGCLVASHTPARLLQVRQSVTLGQSFSLPIRKRA